MSAARFLAVVETTVPPVPLWLEVDATMLQKIKVSNVPFIFTLGPTEQMLAK